MDDVAMAPLLDHFCRAELGELAHPDQELRIDERGVDGPYRCGDDLSDLEVHGETVRTGEGRLQPRW